MGDNYYNCTFPAPSPFKSYLNEFCIFENSSGEAFKLRALLISTYGIFIILNFYMLLRSRKKI